MFHHNLISGGRVTTGIGMLFGSCLGTVTTDQPDSHDDDTADDHAGPSGDGGGVAVL